MKKRVLAVFLCCVIVALCGCTGSAGKYKRIKFEKGCVECGGTNELPEDTVIINDVQKDFPDRLPIYKIVERSISDHDLQRIMNSLEIPADLYELDHQGNRVSIWLDPIGDTTEGFYEMEDDQALDLAGSLFEKIPFMEGEYVCSGIHETMHQIDKEGRHVVEASASFYRVLNGMRVTGEPACTLTFNGGGLARVTIELYDYQEKGTMELVPYGDARARMKKSDDFSLSGVSGKVDALKVEQVELRLINQYSRGCEILQPVYRFEGTATMEDSTEKAFTMMIIAIPEEMTYE